jgi:hypothetical protein
MTRDELLDCMREAAEALSELAEASPPGADEEIAAARRHVEQAIAMVEGRVGRSRGDGPVH